MRTADVVPAVFTRTPCVMEVHNHFTSLCLSVMDGCCHLQRGGPGPSVIRTCKCMSAPPCADSTVKSSYMESRDKVLYWEHAWLPRRAHGFGQQPQTQFWPLRCSRFASITELFLLTRNTQQLKSQIIPTPIKLMVEEVNSVYMPPPVCMP